MLSPDQIHRIITAAPEPLSQSFTLELDDDIKQTLKQNMGLDLTGVKQVPLRWAKGDTPAHADHGIRDFKNTHLVYLTDSEGEFVVDGEVHAITAGAGFVFPTGASHETRGTGTTPRLLLGPMSEGGMPVGAPTYYTKIEFTSAGWVNYINNNGLSLSQYGNGGGCLTLQMIATGEGVYQIIDISGYILGEAVNFLPSNPTNYVYCDIDNIFNATSPYLTPNGFAVTNAANTHQYELWENSGLLMDGYFNSRTDPIGSIVYGANNYYIPGTILNGNGTVGCTALTVPGSVWLARIQATYNYSPIVSSNVPIACLLPPPGPIPCFLADAPVLTPTGYRPIASLKVGDLVTSPSGPLPIQHVKITRVSPSAGVNPYIIKKGQFGATKRLLISPNHRVKTDAGMIEAYRLGLRQEEMSESFDYYNLELPKWSNMIVAGVTVESLAPVKRITMTMQEFKAFVTERYGPMTPELYKRIQKSARMLQDGRIAFNSLGA